ncbi:aromatic acid exporter family protein [Streptomyces cinereoruber]|uniref:aromatic acid exporter family protein n=1 Tax=Streptomyces cinereoruber TaxID=67260 RepID=UPI00363689EE
MSESKTRAVDWCRRRWHTTRTSLEDALRGPGEARDGVLLLVKGAAAATVAWCLSSWLLPTNVTAFAPFTALLALQATVYRSLWDSAQYLGAMAIGTAVAAGFGSTVGVHAWTLCVLVFVALAVARLPLLGGRASRSRWWPSSRSPAAADGSTTSVPWSRPPPSACAAASPPTSPSPPRRTRPRHGAGSRS